MIINTSTFRNKITITIPVPSVPFMSMTACAVVEGWQGRTCTALSCTKLLKWLDIYSSGKNSFNNTCEPSLKCIFFNCFGAKFWLPKWKSLAVIPKVLFCRPCTCLHHQKFCLCKAISVQAFSLTTWWRERGQTGVEKIAEGVSKGLCDMLKQHFCWIPLSIWPVIWHAQPSTPLIHHYWIS